jgi:pyrroline-5-carboxylate reductase
MKITIIGAGTMGKIFKKSLPKGKVTIIDKADKTPDSDVYIFAVKPQDFKKAAERLKGVKGKILISIMAGVPISTITKELPGNKIIRSMPNLGSRTGDGMTVWKSKGKFTPAQSKLIKNIFSSIGAELEVKKEDLLDVAVAVAGSGPGYIYHIAASMTKTANQLGFSKKDAELLVKQTLKGSSEVWLAAKETSAEELEKQVTSKKGTTDAAIKTFKKHKLSQTISKGIKAAYARAKELSKL